MSAAATTTVRDGVNGRFEPATAAGVGRLVRFQSGGHAFALPLERVAEVVALGLATAAAPRGWIGTLARGGRPVPVGDLAYLLGGNGQAVARREMRAVILRSRPEGAESSSPLFGVTVDTVPAVIEIGAERPVALPALARRHAAALVKASLIRAEELILILDPDAIVERLAAGVVRGADGRISDLRALPRRPNGDTGRFAPATGRAVVPASPARETRALLLGGIEHADGGGNLIPAMPMDWVQEVRPLEPLRPIPHAPAGLSGVVAWRGRCLPVLDLPHRLTGILSAETSRRRLLIVGPQGGEPLGGLIVPGVRGLVTIAADPAVAVSPRPDTLDPGLLRAWTRHNGEAVAILDPASCFA